MTTPVLKDRKLLLEEQESLSFLEQHMPSLVPTYNLHLDTGRRGILHKLASSILREDINGYRTNAVTVTNAKLEEAPLSEALRRQLQTYPLSRERTYQIVVIQESAVVFPIIHHYAFHRMETTDEILFVNHKGIRSFQTASELADTLFSVDEYANLETFKKELDNGTANMTMAHMFDEVWCQQLRSEAARLNADSILEYIQKQELSSYLFFEQLSIEGHHLHPGAKTKLGMKQPDAFRYSPEFHQTFPVRFVAVDCRHLAATQSAILEKDYPEERRKGLAELIEKGYVPEDYDILPVHDWQYHHAIPFIYEQEIAEGTIVPIEGVQLTVEATSSFRTVSPVHKGGPALKLAVNSQMTSTIRSISPQTALNSTVFSNMMTEILKKEPQLSGFVPLNETAGAAFWSEDELKKRNLTMLMRENIEEKLEEDEMAVAGMALYASSPMSEKTILHELVDQFASKSGLQRDKAAEVFFEDYIHLIVPGYLTLMVKYGVALEGHLQNSVPVFKDGRLSRFFFRDWGGARIFEKRLHGQGIRPGFSKGSVSLTTNMADVHNKLYYTVFQNHIGEIIRQLVLYSGLPEDRFWNQVRVVCDQTLETLALQEDVTAHVNVDRIYLYQPVVMHKSLTKMRLINKKGDRYNEVPNPLAGGINAHDY